ncbi:hypothetical protein SCLCIDRAFT_26859 [Scleroderma citrinum Foug A]|uniref:CxC2-like cysteine cluster KDZ transposase-associated domain-containing protein n=1 Tax=Scleroderma citrinum Foug A TaxID=1036808 RepID=A0A0C2ZEA7_9AGAM|nr:hypothetical protein SCLCIDRAFT_26859 [Scleroderma citrinum Foug A]
MRVLEFLDSQVMFMGIHGIDVSQVFTFSPSSGTSRAGQTHAHPLAFPLARVYCTITFMQQESYQSNGPSPPRPAGSLRFQKTTGFTIHKRKAEDMESTRHHTKFQLDSHGALWLTTQVITTPNIAPKATTAERGVTNNHKHLSYPGIPDCNDRLPPEVNLGILDVEPRRQMESDFPLLTWLKLDHEDYLSELLRLEDNTSLNPPKARYEQFLRIVRQWHHLKMLKQSGRGHDPAGVLNTKEGECAVLCPACPQPGKNIVALSSVRDIDVLFVALDANFRLRHRVVSSDENNPSLSRGWLYFVEETVFKMYLRDHKNNIQEKSNCSNHNAVNMADVKTKRGCDASGVGMVVCARHGMRLPNGVADLQYGERYVNMEYAFALALRHSGAIVLKVSYDIAYLHDRDVMFLVPKFHLPAHITSCQWSFSFNWTKGIGRTDGEEPERGWANLNAAALSTKEMGPGHRQDTLDDYFGDWNWKKLIMLGPSILRKVKEAIPERNDHQQDFEELTWSLMLKFPVQLALWKQQVEEWENDLTKPNPFEVKNDGITQASVHLQLAKDEAKLSVGESELSLHPDVMPSIFISTGIDLEEQQRHLHEATKLGLCTTDTQQARVQQRSNLLMRRIEAWQQIQVLFMPGVSTLRKEWSELTNRPHSPDNVPLFLPSQMTGKAGCPHVLNMVEFQLREGQAHDSLNNLHQGLRSCTYILKFKDWFLQGQGENTQAQNCLKLLDAKIDAAATRYCIAYHALCTLGPLLGQVGWRDELRPLADEDVCGLMNGYDLHPGEGRCQISWIWRVCGYSEQATENESDDGFQEAIRVEWCKARARTHHWQEEVKLLFEEMQRTLRFLEWHAKWWTERTSAIVTTNKAVSEGHHAYAEHQAELWHQIGWSFAHMWRDTQRFLDVANAGSVSSPSYISKSLCSGQFWTEPHRAPEPTA